MIYNKSLKQFTQLRTFSDIHVKSYSYWSNLFQLKTTRHQVLRYHREYHKPPSRLHLQNTDTVWLKFAATQFCRPTGNNSEFTLIQTSFLFQFLLFLRFVFWSDPMFNVYIILRFWSRAALTSHQISKCIFGAVSFDFKCKYDMYSWHHNSHLVGWLQLLQLMLFSLFTLFCLSYQFVMI